MNKNQDQGFTLLELLTALAIIGILSAITTPLVLWANKPLQNATYQAAGIFSQGRSRAIATTSALRIQPDPSDPDHTLLVEASDTRSCDPNTTQLTSDTPDLSNQLAVVTTQGFAAGDRLKIGDDETENVVLTTDSSSSTITLGSPIGTTQTNGTNVEILSNWGSDKTFFKEDMTLPDNVEISSNLNNWVLCFDSRGIASVSDDSGITTENLEITLISDQSAKEGIITVYQGGLIDSVVIQPKQEAVVASADTTTSTTEEETTATDTESTESSGGDSSSSTPPEETSTEEASTEPETSTETEVTEAPETPPEYELDNGVLVEAEDTSETPPEEEPEAQPEPEEEETLTFEQKLTEYYAWLDQNEYYQSVVQGTETLDYDSEPYKTFVKDVIEKLTWLYS